MSVALPEGSGDVGLASTRLREAAGKRRSRPEESGEMFSPSRQTPLVEATQAASCLPFLDDNFRLEEDEASPQEAGQRLRSLAGTLVLPRVASDNNKSIIASTAIIESTHK
ncbi:hypothetical protein Bbelb_026990 [Branchiostoma belcheri]|nr:hypothetical protein Bbelb_026990 [Branchiostoma belcheri]